MPLPDWLAQPACRRLSLTLVHFLWQGAAVAAVVCLVIRLLRLRHGPPRYAAYLTGLVAMIACLPVTFLAIAGSRAAGDDAPRPPVTAVSSAPTHRTTNLDGPGGLTGTARPPEAAMAPASQPQPRTAGSIRQRLAGLVDALLPWVTAGWLAGVIVLSLRLLSGSLALRRWRRGIAPLPAELDRRVQPIAERLGLGAGPRVFISTVVAQPLTMRCLRPIVLIPAAMLTGLTPEVLEAVIAHELAHVRRLDPWVNLLQRLAETLLFYQPAVWWMSGRLRDEREHCCDELAVSATGARMAYVCALEQVATMAVGARAATAAFGGPRMSVLARVRHVLGHASTPVAPGRWLAGVAAMAAVCLLALGVWLPCNAAGDGIITIDSPRVAGVPDVPGAPDPAGGVPWQALGRRVSPGHLWEPSMSWVWGKGLRLRKNPPRTETAPAKLGSDPLFASWPCPRAKDGRILIALARSSPDAPYDSAYMDLDGDGRLSDEAVVWIDKPSYDRVKVQWHPEFALAGRSGSSPHKLGLYIMKTSVGRTLWTRSELWRQGTVTVGGRKRRCVVADYSINGVFNDISDDFAESDRIAIKIGRLLTTHVLGRYIDIDGELYRPEVSQDGSAIRFVPAGEVPMASIALPEGMGLLTVFGRNGTYTLRPGKGKVSLPAGRYRIQDWIQSRRDDSQRLWTLSGRLRGDSAAFDLPAGGPTRLDIGDPVVGFLTHTRTDGEHSMQGGIVGRRGEILSLRSPQGEVVRRGIRITSADGQVDKFFALAPQYGGGGPMITRIPVTWKPPAGVTGPFTASIELPGPFRVQLRPPPGGVKDGGDSLPVAKVPLVKAPPTVDGMMDLQYAASTAMPLKFLSGSPAAPSARTTARAVSTADTLYLFVRCELPDMNDLVAESRTHDDGRLWHDDTVELFIDPTNRRQMDGYMHITANALGTTRDAKGPQRDQDLAWNPKMTVRTRIGEDAWTLEIAIPFAELGVKAGQVNKAWAVNVNRMAYLAGGAEDTAWSPTGSGNSHMPSRFGLMLLEAGTIDNTPAGTRPVRRGRRRPSR